MKPVCLPEKYEILGELGEGGMGLVYHARDRVLDREVALKVLSERYAANPQFVQRFLAEARAAACLNHPNIVQIYEFGQTGEGHYLAMELVRGQTLKAELKKAGRFSESQTLDLVLKVCRTLSVAHAAGIVHRDVKPENMMFTADRAFKLVDLGLAKSLDEDVNHTVTGQSLGTPHFISPEQIRGARDIDGRADIYSLGATMYNLATGHVPFDGTSGAHIMARHLNDPLPDPRQVAPDLSVGFCRILGRMMAKDPDDRYPDMYEVERDLFVLQQGGAPAAVGPVPTAVQQTVFMAAPDLAAPETGAGWKVKDLDRITGHLAEHIGPLAGVLVRKATENARNWTALGRILADNIPDVTAREAFLQVCARMGAGGGTTTASRSIPPDPALSSVTMPLGAGIGPAFCLDETEMTRVTGLLADRIGPVAGALVRRELKTARNLADLTARLADAIPDQTERRTFAAAMGQSG